MSSPAISSPSSTSTIFETVVGASTSVEVFRDWPYLYDGTLDYEQTYLRKFAASDGAIIVAAYDGDTIVGVATAAPMIHHATEFAAPFADQGYDITRQLIAKMNTEYGLRQPAK